MVAQVEKHPISSILVILGTKPTLSLSPYLHVFLWNCLFGGLVVLVIAMQHKRCQWGLGLSWQESFLRQSKILFKDYNKMFWAVHLIGPEILSRLEKLLDLFPGKINASRRALMDYGNASCNTILYVLEYMIELSLKMIF
ncbi:type III polyketide synthase B-like [Durio zibethinus]|uniref:Type III polyketide synthase B-like n=1 Tax=Durio zibethinus TaxID=66656 RepID=A0A6P5XBU1_DURZI|nr:type III polyketide synthase B-like [Durio zibethinus]